MKHLKNHKYAILGLFGMAFWLVETAYFGWNMKAATTPERMLDSIAFICMFWGVIGDITHNLTITKAYKIYSPVTKVYNYGRKPKQEMTYQDSERVKFED